MFGELDSATAAALGASALAGAVAFFKAGQKFFKKGIITFRKTDKSLGLIQESLRDIVERGNKTTDSRLTQMEGRMNQKMEDRFDQTDKSIKRVHRRIDELDESNTEAHKALADRQQKDHDDLQKRIERLDDRQWEQRNPPSTSAFRFD